ncbi:telethonin [Anguilla anguilla]|uniref:telethonin n=1 Tax=Anguilla anguilla TaxID=7936 RepID=UPI0015A88FB2|nr:telethonin [Anguilla anguilla]
MQGRTTLVKRAGVVTGAELGCSVREENQVQRESYSADWRSITINTQPQDRQTVQEADDSRRETFSRQWEARRLLQACPSGVIRLGTLERGVREHQQLPYRKSLPLPLFTPTELGTRLGRGAPHTQEDLRPLSALDGACPAKRDVGDITKDLPPVKPIRMEFAKAPKSLGRSMSQEAQRG